MDSSDRNDTHLSEQDRASTAADKSQNPGAGDAAQPMFGQDADAWEEARRVERKRIAVWGLATGGVMAAVVALCLLLAYLASSA